MKMWMLRINNLKIWQGFHYQGIVGKFLKNRGTCAISAERFTSFQGVSINELIQQHTVITSHSLTPEIALHLITPDCPLWATAEQDIPFTDPFWAFYWPGGQALTRFILDNPAVVLNKTVVDVGSGCGASAIAAVISGASHVIANDTDPVAGIAIDLNSNLNNVKVQFSDDNFVGMDLDQIGCVLIGDMFYDEEFADILMDWIYRLQVKKKSIFLGDPGRLAFIKYKSCFQCVAEYELLHDSLFPGLSCTSVWTVK